MDGVKADLALAAVKSTPPVVGFVITLDQVVGVFTLLYLAAQFGHLIWRWRNDIDAKRAALAAAGKPQP